MKYLKDVHILIILDASNICNGQKLACLIFPFMQIDMCQELSFGLLPLLFIRAFSHMCDERHILSTIKCHNTITVF